MSWKAFAYRCHPARRPLVALPTLLSGFRKRLPLQHHARSSARCRAAPMEMVSRWRGIVSMAMGLLLAVCLGVDAEEIRGTLAMPDRSVVPTTKVVLNGGQYTGLTAKDGSFAFRDVTPGVYLLEVQSATFHYSTMKIKVDEKTGIIAVEYKYPGAQRKEAIHPLLLTAHTKWNHFEKREGMKVGGMFKSPMTIMMIASMVMMVFLPKMMANLDPEQLEEIKGQQKSVTDAASGMSFSDLFSNALAGAAPQAPAAPPAPVAQTQRAGSSKGTRGKKRHG